MSNCAIDSITEKIIGCAFEVHKTLGSGFLEKVYENALVVELQSSGLAVTPQYPISISYKRKNVGEYMADMVVNGVVIVELKSVKEIAPIHVSQCLHYLKATEFPVCLLLNFGSGSLGIKRLTLEAEYMTFGVSGKRDTKR